MGTPDYMAPEQIDRPSEVDHRADIYSLGVVFYQMLTGELPTGRPGETFDPPSRKVVIDVRLDEVVLRALEKEPARRYQQASQVRTEVETIVSTPPGPATADAAESPPAQPKGTIHVESELQFGDKGKVRNFSRTYSIVGMRGQRRVINWDVVSQMCVAVFLVFFVIVSIVSKSYRLGFDVLKTASILTVAAMGLWIWRAWRRPQDHSPSPNSADQGVPPTKISPTGTLSPWCRIIGIFFGITYTSPLAIRITNISAIGFLGFLSCLGYVPLPGMQRCFGLSGFFGFFGLIGVGQMIEAAARRKAKTAEGQSAHAKLVADDSKETRENFAAAISVIISAIVISAYFGILSQSSGSQLLFVGCILPVAILLVILAFAANRRRLVPPIGTQKRRRWRTRLLKGLLMVPVIIVVAFLVRQNVLGVYRMESDAFNREIPQGSRIFVYRLARTFEPGDIILYHGGDRDISGRVLESGPTDGKVIVERNGQRQSIAMADMIGRVVVNTRSSTAPPVGSNPVMQAWHVATVLIFFLASYLIVRWAWRAAKRPVNHAEPPPAAPPNPSVPGSVTQLPASGMSQPTSVDHPSARFSRTAIVGAAWAAFALVATAQSFLESRGVVAPAESSPPADGKWLWLLLRMAPALGCTAFLGTTICGAISLSQIRRSAGRLYGLGLALFDTLLFPLLAMDGLILWGCYSLAYHEGPIVSTGGGTLQAVSYNAWVMVLGVLTCAVLDFFIIRWAWRAAKRPVNHAELPLAPASAQPPGRSVAVLSTEEIARIDKARQDVKGPAIGLTFAAGINVLILLFAVVLFAGRLSARMDLRASIFIALPVLIGLIGLPVNLFVLWGAIGMMRVRRHGVAIAASILAMLALPGSLIGLPMGIWSLVVLSRREVKDAFFQVRKARIGEPRRHRGLLVVLGLVVLLVAGVGLVVAKQCSRRAVNERAEAKCRYIIFTISKNEFDPIIPSERRTGVEGSVYSRSNVSSGELDSLLAKADVCLRKEHSIFMWPQQADGWTYAQCPPHFGAGGGSGFLGIRRSEGRMEMRVEYGVNHSIDAKRPINSRIFYQGPVPTDSCLLFAAPFEGKDGGAFYHVIVFDVSTPAAGDHPKWSVTASKPPSSTG